MSAACLFCGGAINPDRDYQQITAWRRKRHGSNSANFVRHMDPVADKWACSYCIEQRMSRGLDPQQQQLGLGA